MEVQILAELLLGPNLLPALKPSATDGSWSRVPECVVEVFLLTYYVIRKHAKKVGNNESA